MTSTAPELHPSTFLQQLVDAVRARVHEVPSAYAAYVVPSGTDFYVFTHEIQPNGFDAVASVAVAVQRELSPDGEIIIDGHYLWDPVQAEPSWIRAYPQ